jgi:F-type H+-transporting ATPase subunit gamma
MAENLRALRRKIKTVRSIEHITRAMQFVAAAKLAKLQKRVAAGRDYAARLRELLRHVAASAPEVAHPYLTQREVKRVGLVLMAGDRGLAGAFNQQIMRAAEDFLAHAWAPVSVITVGAKATGFAQRRGLEILASYPVISELGRSSPALELARQVRSFYDQETVDQVHVLYEDYQSVLRHRPQVEQFLPIPAESAGAAAVWGQYDYDPPPDQLLQVLLPQALDAVIYQMALGTATAEQAARMTAMRAATDAAGDMITGLTRRLNRARQYGITSEIMDVIGGASAMGAV